ncbi:MAG: signal peptidase I [Cyanobacteria bacterium SZAS TMP-1]|nr:signal peptidase I [Cyanobacteria bacterium SZAS TMP-1]
MKSLFAVLGMLILSTVLTLTVLIVFHQFVETRWVPSTSMQPTIEVEDRVLVEKASKLLNRGFTRGEIVVFYPPAIETGKELSGDPMHVLGRLTGLPQFPNDPAFIKRIIGLPGDTIRIVGNEGVYVNGHLLPEPYVKEPARYTMTSRGDIKGRDLNLNMIQLEKDPQSMLAPVIVPKDQLFVLGDDRNASEDSHIWGFLPKERIIGRAYVMLLRVLSPPRFPKPDQKKRP